MIFIKFLLVMLKRVRLRLRLELKNISSVLEFSQSERLKLDVEFNLQERIEAEKNSDKDKNAL